jgi:hypothetical protein
LVIHGPFNILDTEYQCYKWLQLTLLSLFDFADKNCSLPDDEAGEVPTAYVVRAAGSNLSKSEVIAFIHKQVRFLWGLFIDVANARKLLSFSLEQGVL